MTVQPGDILEMPCVTASRRFRETCIPYGTIGACETREWLQELWCAFELWEDAYPLGDYAFAPTPTP